MSRAVVGMVGMAVVGVACAHGEPRRAAAPQPEPVGSASLTSGGAGAGSAPGQMMRGLFRYRADAATFEDCATGRRVPVAMEGGYLVLERAATSARGGAGVVATVRGHVEPRERVDGAAAATREDTLVVDDVVATSEDTAGCAAATPSSASLTGTRWVLVEIDGQPVAPPADPEAQPASLVFAVDAQGTGLRLSGFGGCNTLRGRWSTAAASPPSATSGPLQVEGVASTRRACPWMATENALSSALSAIRRFEVTGASLVLFDDHGVRARFEAKDDGAVGR